MKILLIIILSLLMLAVLVSLLNVHIEAYFNQELCLKVRVFFVKVQLLPSREKKEKPKKKRNKKKKEAAEKTKEDESGGIKKILKEKGVSGFLDMLRELTRLALSVLSPLLSHLKVRCLSIKISYAGKDAAKTAVGYGECCAAVYPFASLIASHTDCKSLQIDVKPNFTEGAKTELDAVFKLKIRIYVIIFCFIKFLAGFIKLKNKGVV